MKIIKQNWKAKLHVRVLFTGDLVDDMSLLLFDEFDFECIKPGMHCLLNSTLILRFKMKVCPTTNSICFFVFLFLIFNKGTKKFFLNFWIFIQGQTKQSYKTDKCQPLTPGNVILFADIQISVKKASTDRYQHPVAIRSLIFTFFIFSSCPWVWW